MFQYCEILLPEKMCLSQARGKPMPARALPKASCHLTSPDPATVVHQVHPFQQGQSSPYKIRKLWSLPAKKSCAVQEPLGNRDALSFFCEQETELLYGLKFLPKSWGKCSRKLQNCENPAEITENTRLLSCSASIHRQARVGQDPEKAASVHTICILLVMALVETQWLNRVKPKTFGKEKVDRTSQKVVLQSYQSSGISYKWYAVFMGFLQIKHETSWNSTLGLYVSFCLQAMNFFLHENHSQRCAFAKLAPQWPWGPHLGSLPDGTIFNQDGFSRLPDGGRYI